MINLLPQRSQRKILRLYRMRLVTVMLFLVAFMLLSAAALLVPSYLLVLSQESAALERKASLDLKIEEQQGGTAQESIRELNQQLDIVEKFIVATSTSEVLGAIHAVRGSDVKINSMAFESSGTKDVVILTGVAATRDTLLRFTQDLKLLPVLSEVTLPVSNLAEATDNQFTITASITTDAPEEPEAP